MIRLAGMRGGVREFLGKDTMLRILLVLMFSFSVEIGTLVPRSAMAQSDTKSLEDVFRNTIDELLKGPNRQDEAGRAPPPSRRSMQMSFSPVVKEAAPSVVNVYAARTVRQRSPFEGDPFFERFFGRNSPFGRPRQRVQSSLGSGVIVTTDGIVLTNNHVVENADEVKIALNDGSEYECDIILKDEKSDLAVLRIRDGGKFDAIEIANSDDVEVGDIVLAIGNPFGVGQTVTSGIVSAVARSRVGVNDFDFFIQTDAAINPGNSGGALVDMRGRLVGINTAIFSRSGGSNGIGFAIPANMVSVVIKSAVSGQSAILRPWLGATFQEVTPEIADSLGLRRPGGVLVASVFPGGPAEKAGIQPGDVVIGINRNIIQNNDALAYRLDTIGVGGDAELILISGRQRKVVNITLIKAPETVPRDETRMDPDTVLGGAVLANLSPAVAQEVGLTSRQSNGVIVMAVPRRSRAAANNVKRGDIVIAINGVEIDEVSDVVSITNRQSRGGWQVVLERAGTQFVFERDGGYYRQYRR